MKNRIVTLLVLMLFCIGTLLSLAACGVSGQTTASTTTLPGTVPSGTTAPITTPSSTAPATTSPVTSSSTTSTIIPSVPSTSTTTASPLPVPPPSSTTTGSVAPPVAGTRGLEYAELSDGTYEVVGYSGTSHSVVIPSFYNGKQVTSIGAQAFEECTELVSVTISEGITSIGDFAFESCPSLMNISIPNTVTNMGMTPFVDCENVEYNTYDNAYYLGNEVNPYVLLVKAVGRKITSCDIHSNTRFIDGGAFYGCSYLASAAIPNDIVDIGERAFERCSSLAVYEYDNAYYIGSAANPYMLLIEARSADITSCNIHENTRFIHGDAFRGCDKLTSIVIPQNVRRIESGVFSGCSSLVSVSIGNGVREIGECSFENCISLEDVTVGNGVEYIGNLAFANCTSIENVYIYDLAAWCEIPFSTVYGKYGDKKDSNSPLYYAQNFYLNGELVTDLVIPEEVGSVEDYAFYGCDSIKSVTIPNSVKSVGDYAFAGCFNLKSLTVGESVESIGEEAFYYCLKLNSITIPNSVTSIGDFAFANCIRLIEVINHSELSVTAGSNDHGWVACYAEEVHAGESKINNVDEYLFYTYNGTHYLFGYTGSDTMLILPETYRGEAYVIHAGAFYECSNLTSVTIPSSVTGIGSAAFYGCTGLTSVAFSENSQLMSIGENAFSNCTNLESITIPRNVTSIGSRAFRDCTGLTSIEIPNGVTSIDEYAFYGCTGLESIVVASGNTVYHSAGNCLIETVSKTLILGCKNSAISTDGSVTNIAAGAFYDCTGLTSIEIPSSVTSIGSWAFSGCTGLTSITIPSSVTSIGSGAFEDCTGLTSIEIPNGVTSIGFRAFYGCERLESVTFGDTSGWRRSKTAIPEEALADAGKAAGYLCSEYCDYTWIRE